MIIVTYCIVPNLENYKSRMSEDTFIQRQTSKNVSQLFKYESNR